MSPDQVPNNKIKAPIDAGAEVQNLPAMPSEIYSTLLAEAQRPSRIGTLIHQILVKSKYQDIEKVVADFGATTDYSTGDGRYFLAAAKIALKLDSAKEMAAVYHAVRNVLCPDPPRNLINFSGWSDVKKGDLLRLRDGKTSLQVIESESPKGAMPNLYRIEGDYKFGAEDFLKDSTAVLSQILVVERPSIETCLEHARKHTHVLSKYSLNRFDVLLMLSNAASESGMPGEVSAESLQVFLDGLHGMYSLSMATPARLSYPLILIELALNHPQAVTAEGVRKIYQAVVNWANPDKNNPYKDPQLLDSSVAKHASSVLNHPSFLKLKALMDSSK